MRKPLTLVVAALVRTLDTSTGHSATGQLSLDEKGTTLYALVEGKRVVEVNTNSATWRPLLEQPALRMVYNAGELIFSKDAELIAWRVR